MRIETSHVKTLLLSTLCACSLSSVTYAEEANALQGIKIGFGADMGLGVAAQMGNYNGFLGNDGLAIDYTLIKEKLGKKPSATPVHWYLGAGGYGQWNGGIGARVPVGIEISFAERFDAYAQVAPELQITDGTKFGFGGGFAVRYQF